MARKKVPLFLHEEVMLLALRDRKGTVEFGSNHGYALGGAILAELLLNGRIAVEETKRKLVNLVSAEPMGDAVLDECLEKVVNAKRRANALAWLNRFMQVKQLHHRVAGSLCERGILRAGEDTVLLLFKRKVYPEIDPLPERKLITRLRNAIFGESQAIDPRTVVLISLANSTGLLAIPFEKKQLKARKRRIKQITEGELMGKAARKAIEAAQAAAIMVTCVIPAVTATS